MESLLSLMRREDDLIAAKDKAFNKRVDLLHVLDEVRPSGQVKQELEQKLKDLELQENILKDDIEQVHMSIKRYMLRLLGK